MSNIINDYNKIINGLSTNMEIKTIDEKKADWILRLRAQEFMSQNDSKMIIPRLFGKGDRVLIACRLRECPTKDRCTNLCPCDVECLCVSKGQSVSV